MLAGGLRVGWATGPAPLVARVALHAQATSLHTSGVAQALAALLLDAWGPDGFDAHVGALCDFYRAQRDSFLAAAERHLGAAPARAGGGALARWTAPADGMCVALRSPLSRAHVLHKRVRHNPFTHTHHATFSRRECATILSHTRTTQHTLTQHARSNARAPSSRALFFFRRAGSCGSSSPA